MDVADHRGEMLTIGALDHRLEELPTLYEHLLADTDASRLDRPEGVTSDELVRLQALAPWVAHTCDRLAGYDLPETVHNGDFHDGNVFVRDGRYLLFDWGDACVAHPFFSCVAILRSVEDRFGLTWRGAEVLHLRDVYLKQWATTARTKTWSWHSRSRACSR